jgi:hypothetical protein
MTLRPVTPSPFERRIPGGRLDLIFRVAYGSTAAAARSLRVSRMRVWRWCHDRSALPEWVADVLAHLVHEKVREAHDAQDRLRESRGPPP